jgi:molybdopterin-binding protein
MVRLGSVQIISVITKKSVQDLCPSKDKEAYAVIKATNVMIAMD